MVDTFTLPISAETPTGDYELAMGFYTWPTLERLPVMDIAGQVAGDNIVLGQVRIKDE